MIVIHDDAKKDGWVVISMKDDWKRVFACKRLISERRVAHANTRQWRLDMNSKMRFGLLVVIATIQSGIVQAQQIPFPQTSAEVPGPVPGAAMTTDYVRMVGRAAYFWGYPLVATSNRRAAFAKAPERILLGGVVPFAPVGYNTMLTGYIKPDEDFIVCPNQDVVYGGGFTALDKEPTVFQVPNFGDRY